MEKLVIKQKISEALENRKVLGVIVHTFNFDPKFFENYVMPLFVDDADAQFRDEEIYNKITWRKCLKEGLVPPVAVYCDYYAKDNTTAPDLSYDIYCIKVPADRGAICNFHPKHLFVLLENEVTNDISLLLLTGSCNMTPSGWCDNIESYSLELIKKNKNRPNSVTTNSLQDYLANINNLANITAEPTAYAKIYSFLNYVDNPDFFFDNCDKSFAVFIDEKIPLEEVEEIEIISPYYSNNDENIRWLKENGIKNIHCLLPTLRTHEVSIDQKTFDLHTQAGVNWCLWENKKVNDEVRNLHAKIYRFYSSNKTYTIIGSVNFTSPAWRVFSKNKNKANIESAWLYIEKKRLKRLLNPKSTINFQNLIFTSKQELEDTESSAEFNRNAPEIEFKIDWKAQGLLIHAKLKDLKCKFYKQFDEKTIENGMSAIELSCAEAQSLAKKSLIKVLVEAGEQDEIYTYYANQINADSKPLGINLSPTNILKFWHFIDDGAAYKRTIQDYAETATDENGIINEGKIVNKSLLNDMAAHFQGLVQLEKHLFSDKHIPLNGIENHFKRMQYYLLSVNVDTISFYLNGLEKQLNEAAVQKSFVWMVYQILIANFYKKAKKWNYRKKIETKEWSIFEKDINNRISKFEKTSNQLKNKIDGLAGKESWVLAEIRKEYGDE